MGRVTSLLVLTVLLAVGCDPVAAPEYRGDVLFRVFARSVDADGAAQPPADDEGLGFLWFDVSGSAPAPYGSEPQDWEYRQRQLLNEDAAPGPVDIDSSEAVFAILGPPVNTFFDSPASLDNDERPPSPPALGFAVVIPSDVVAFPERLTFADVRGAHAEHAVVYRPDGDGPLAAYPEGLHLVARSSRAEADPAATELSVPVDDNALGLAAVLDDWLTP